MSLHDYQESQRIPRDVSFDAVIMAALRRADTTNFTRLAFVFPDLCREWDARQDAPGGRIAGDP